MDVIEQLENILEHIALARMEFMLENQQGIESHLNSAEYEAENLLGYLLEAVG